MANLGRPAASVCALLLAIVSTPILAQRPERPPGVPLTIHTPQPEEFDLALDEIELDSSRVRASARSRPTGVREARVTASRGARAVLAFRTITTTSELLTVARELEAANLGARAQFVLYERGRPRTAATRRVLTSQVAVILAETDDPRRVIAAYAAYGPQPLRGVEGAYVLEAGDPLAAIDLAEQVSAQAGVRAAYPLLERQQFLR